MTTTYTHILDLVKDAEPPADGVRLPPPPLAPPPPAEPTPTIRPPRKPEPSLLPIPQEADVDD